jgi:hypothetical protein
MKQKVMSDSERKKTSTSHTKEDLDQQKWSESKSNTQFNGIINKMKQLKID